MNRGEYTWLNVSDGNNAIFIWVKSSDLGDICVAGRYDAYGDTVKITGLFHSACADHGGDFDIRAKSIGVVKKGNSIKNDVNGVSVILAVVLFVIALCCMTMVLKQARQKYRAGAK